MMASKKCSDLIRQANSSRIKYAYTALVEIRKKYMKTPRDVGMLVDARLVQRLLDLIRSRDSLEEQYMSKVIDISLSILGNMCMEGVTRKQVLKDKKTGVTILVELFEEVEPESLQNRACRCLSNMLLDPGSWELVCCSSVIEKIVKLLQDTEKDEIKQTCIRALRLLGQTGPHVQKLVEKNVISVTSKLIDSDVDTLKSSALRCIHSLSVHGSTLQFARQVIASGKIPYLLSLVKESNIEAFQIVTRLCEHHNFRAEFGNSGGITMFYEEFSSQEPFWEYLREDLLSVLCLCCKEAVNRVKLRDENVLRFFIQSLEDAKFRTLHARIISALVCFLYDETSFDVLLDNGLVPLLINHLKTYIMQENDAGNDDDDGHDSHKKEKEAITDKLKDKEEVTEPHDSKQTAGRIEDIEDSEPKLNTEPNIHIVIDPAQEIKPEIEVEQEGCQDNLVEDKVEKKTEVSLEDTEHEETELFKESDDGNEKETNEFKTNQDAGKVTKRPVYSIDSPSYRSSVEWEPQDYQGAKCIERFTPPHSFEYSLKSSYSPLSNCSYYSPGESSPEYSPPSSPNTSPSPQRASRKIFPETSPSSCHSYNSLTGSQSPENYHPKYTGINCKLYRTSLSPATSPECSKRSISPFNTDLSSPERGSQEVDVNDAHDNLFLNSSEGISDDPFTLEESPLDPEQTQAKVKHSAVDSSQGFDYKYDKTDIENTSNVPDNVKSEFIEEGNENFNKKLATLKETLIKEKGHCKRKRVPSRNNVTEYNILVLLSRVSQMTDPTMQLVTMEVLDGMFNYMSIMEFPLARCPRLLSRVFRNPLCFNKLLMLSIPMTIFDKLLKNEDLNALTKDLHNKKKIVKRKSSYGKAEIEHEVSADEDRFSVSDDSIEEEHLGKRRKIAEGVDKSQQSFSFKGMTGFFYVIFHIFLM
ncbi:uncharacterized protein LOC132727962 isoform X1 [Ruditapes philippinarum]|uniref:uncharacterized protein LOC132727962 isoform X1 n=2 Tax=Ruditapes philippinarum TaxID=129788 RepID=UPI00295C0F6C|nr:uncharacterized protein LOC132727962 isoform X1 [Ruditapes philippinarum]